MAEDFLGKEHSPRSAAIGDFDVLHYQLQLFDVQGVLEERPVNRGLGMGEFAYTKLWRSHLRDFLIEPETDVVSIIEQGLGFTLSLPHTADFSHICAAMPPDNPFQLKRIGVVFLYVLAQNIVFTQEIGMGVNSSREVVKYRDIFCTAENSLAYELVEPETQEGTEDDLKEFNRMIPNLLRYAT